MLRWPGWRMHHYRLRSIISKRGYSRGLLPGLRFEVDWGSARLLFVLRRLWASWERAFPQRLHMPCQH
jgi:hypothetical protein